MKQEDASVNLLESLRNKKIKADSEIKEAWLAEIEAMYALGCSKSTLRFFRKNDLIEHYKLKDVRYYDVFSIQSPSIVLRSQIISTM